MLAKLMRKSLVPVGGCIALTVVAVMLSSMFAGSRVSAQQAPAAHQRWVRPAGFIQPAPVDFNDHKGWTQIFNGKNLKGWNGNPKVWHVEDGSIVGESSPQHPSGTTNIIWQGGAPANFELKAEMKLEGAGANGGIQYRSAKVGQWGMKGYQADFDFANVYTGQLYEQGTGRGIIAWRGQMVETDPGRRPRLLATLGNSDDLKKFIKPGQWNQYEVIADGNTLIHIVNGHVMAILVDNDPAFSRSKGLIGFEIEGGGNVKISQRDVWLKILP